MRRHAASSEGPALPPAVDTPTSWGGCFPFLWPQQTTSLWPGTIWVAQKDGIESPGCSELCLSQQWREASDRCFQERDRAVTFLTPSPSGNSRPGRAVGGAGALAPLDKGGSVAPSEAGSSTLPQACFWEPSPRTGSSGLDNRVATRSLCLAVGSSTPGWGGRASITGRIRNGELATKSPPGFFSRKCFWLRLQLQQCLDCQDSNPGLMPPAHTCGSSW